MLADGRCIRNMTLISCRSIRGMAHRPTTPSEVMQAQPITLTAVMPQMAATTVVNTEVPQAAMTLAGIVAMAVVEEMEVAVETVAEEVAAAVAETGCTRRGTKININIETVKVARVIGIYHLRHRIFRWPPFPPAGYDFQYTSAPVNP